MLVRLPNGSWVDPEYVMMVEPRPGGNSALPDGPKILPSTVVHLADGGKRVITCPTYMHALQLTEIIVKSLQGVSPPSETGASNVEPIRQAEEGGGQPTDPRPDCIQSI